MSAIEWTEKTWNPTAGCSVLSPGCTNCYAMAMAARLRRIDATAEAYAGTVKGRVWTGRVNLLPDRLDTPRGWKTPTMVFVNSMSDLFHEAVPLGFIREVFDVMVDTPRHTYQILTKRAERLAELAPALWWPKNLWMGVSVERQDFLPRFDYLAGTPAAVKFISYEPALGPVTLNGHRPDWVIFGGESGTGKRPVDLAWARSMRDECAANDIAFFVKQVDKVRAIPADLMIREWPAGEA